MKGMYCPFYAELHERSSTKLFWLTIIEIMKAILVHIQNQWGSQNNSFKAKVKF